MKSTNLTGVFLQPVFFFMMQSIQTKQDETFTALETFKRTNH